jgi:GNAT superfamily N-acetyltransferase
VVSPATAIKVRALHDSDLAQYLAIRNAVAPERPISLEEARHDDARWDSQRYHRARFAAEEVGGRILGWGQIAHLPWHFHPRKYGLRLEVDPGQRRRGIGGQLFTRLLEELRARGAVLARADATEDNAEGIGFLARRGFLESWRYLQSRLEVATFDPAPFAGAAEQVARQGVTITTLAQEMARDPGVLREVYRLHLACGSGVQEIDTLTPPPFEEFVGNEIHGPRTLLDGWFLAHVGRRLVGESTLERLPGSPQRLEVGATGVLPEFRRRGIARALKLQTIAYAREHGFQSIETNSNAGNTPMLRLNTALGFRPQPARITFELRLG